MKKCTFWIAILSLAVSLGTIAVIVMDVWEISVIDSNSFISGLVALFSLAITILLGFQIYNSIELSDKLKEIDVLKQNIQEIRNVYELGIKKNNSEFETLRNELYERTNITLAKLYYAAGENEKEILLIFTSIIKFSLDISHPEGYKWLLDDMEMYMLNIVLPTFCKNNANKNICETIKEFKNLLKKEDIIIRNHSNYLYIKDRYEELMDKFEVRLLIISEGKNVSDKFLDKEA